MGSIGVAIALESWLCPQPVQDKAIYFHAYLLEQVLHELSFVASIDGGRL